MSTIDYAKARELMVEQQIRPWDVLDARVLDVLSTLPRDAFVPEEYRAMAYSDLPLPLPHGERMMKPVVEGRTLQALSLTPHDEVLEVGTGTGFLAACMGRLAREVTTLERHGDLATAAAARVAAHGIANVNVIHADALDWNTSRQFDVVCVSGAVDVIPERFIGWLKPGGRLFAVRGRSPAMEAVLLHNDGGKPRIESLFETDLPYLAGTAPEPVFEF